MNKKIIIALAVIFCLKSFVNYAQLFPVGKVGDNFEIKHGFINAKGKLVIPYTYLYALEFSDGMGVVSGETYQSGYINSSGKLVVPHQYDYAYPFKNGYAIVGTIDDGIVDQKGFVLDRDGKEFPIKDLFVSPENSVSDGLVVIADYKLKKGYANLNNEVIIPIQYPQALPFSEGYATVQKGDSLYLIDTKGNERNLIYINTLNMKNGLMAVQARNQKWGFVNDKLEVIIDFKYDNLNDFHNGYAQFIQDGSVGLMDKKGVHVLPPIYASINQFNENRIIVQTDLTEATLLDENFKVMKEYTNIHDSDESLKFNQGLCPLYFSVPPNPKGKTENERTFPSISKCYINLSGEIVWHGDPNFSCFPENSKVKMADFSEREIQNIEAGDEIMTFNEKTKQFETTLVLKLEKHQGNFNLMEITINSTSSITAALSATLPLKSTIMTATPNHPIWTKEGVKLIQDISEKDTLIVWNDEFQAFEELRVSSVTPIQSTTTVYNLKTVNQNYVVNSVVVMLK